MTVSARAAWVLLVPILLAYGYIAVGYARGTPRWNNPDEPAHVNVIRQIAQTGTLPVLEPGDWDQELLDRLRTHWFPNDYEIDGIRYEGHQPPLYYLLAAPVHRLTVWMPLNRQIVVLRLFSIAIGAVAVVAAFVVAREVAPDRPALAVLTAATFAFVPMNTAILAAVNNDALATALAAVTLAALTIGLRRGFSDRWAVGLGILVGLLVLTKLTVYVFVPLILLTLLAAGRSLRWPLIAAGVGLLVAGWWLVRNMLLYGPLDPLAMVRHDEIVVGQPRWAAYNLESLDFFFRILFRSFWGMFGWMGVVLDDGFYILFLVLTALGVAGRMIPQPQREKAPHPPTSSPAHGRGGEDRQAIGRSPSTSPRRKEAPEVVTSSPSPAHGGGGTETRDTGTSYPPAPAHGDVGVADIRAAQRGGWGEGASSRNRAGTTRGNCLLLGGAALLVFAEVAYYNLTFIQPQGRYLFPALVPIALFLATGWWRLARGRWTVAVLAGAIAWSLGEVYGSLRAPELWSDNALIAAAAVGAAIVAFAPRAVRVRLPDALCLLLAVTLGLLDYAALVKFVAPSFPVR